ncbi:argininosuccinate lyase [Caldisericum exile]|uniref:argininosuccinate lyase n=1 Tax=Caldisericum exile TaxID=693075 RepID=UPI003C758310
MGRLWDISNKIDKGILSFTVYKDNKIDEKLIKYDILASIAHAKMLAKIGIISEEEKEKILDILNELLKKAENNQIKIEIEIEEEDMHTKIENYLTQKLGELGEKIHTARSRNDQVMVALRLFYKDKLKEVEKATKKFIKVLKKFEEKFGSITIPGLTHTRKAIPTTVNIWIGSFIESLRDDLKLLRTVKNFVDQNPLGSGAGFGIPAIEVDREYTTKLLNFSRTQNNPLYVQNSRGKFESLIAHAISMIMYDINKLSTDLILFSFDEIGFVKLPKEILTGSSMMPNKENPDIFEIARGSYSKIIILEEWLNILPMNLISGYHRDLQFTKEAIFEVFETAIKTINIMAKTFSEIQIDEEKAKKLITKEMYATENVNKLVLNGLPFREAYKIVKRNLSKPKD